MPDLPAALRRAVVTRAGRRCEYCLIAEEDTFLDCQVDHIISRKHGGTDALSNLALACAACNRRKGADIGSLDRAGNFTRFFNPRVDVWRTHFRVSGAMIEPLTAIGSATGRIFAFTSPERLSERLPLVAQRRYPPPRRRTARP